MSRRPDGPEAYEILLDPAASIEGAPRLELPDGVAVTMAAEVLEMIFAVDFGLDRLAVVVGSEMVGATSRRHVQPPDASRGVGEGDGATLPGYSTRYEVFRFSCSRCSSVTYRLQVDQRAMPTCPQGHGPLELAG